MTALAACGDAGADSSAKSGSVAENVFSGLKAPAGWISLPAIADVMRDAARSAGANVIGREAWGEPSRGCYAVWMRLGGSGAKADVIVSSFGGTDAVKAGGAILTSDVVKPTAIPGTLSFAWKRGVYAGKLRAKITADGVEALSCFANDREPKACEAGCNAMLGAML
ncbi:MAG TPA: hypothetical protein VGM39_00895 [Kofleriaceae bacterium]|jgi:hypothetical protein